MTRSGKRKKLNDSFNNTNQSECTACYCLEPFDSNEKKVACNGCKKNFHIECVTSNKSQHKLVLANKDWKCATCLNEVLLKNSAPDDSEENGTVNKKLNQIITSQIFMSAKFDQMLKQNLDAITENKQLKTRVLTLENESKGLKSRVNALEYNVYKTNQSDVNNQLIINNLPVIENENLIDIVKNISSILKVAITSDNIICVRRMINKTMKSKEKEKGKKTDELIPPILVEFTTEKLRDAMIEARKHEGPIKLSQLGEAYTSAKATKNGNEQDEQIIYISHYLIKHFQILMKNARSFKQKYAFKYVWFDVKACCVRMREKDDSPTTTIKHQDELNALDETFVK